VTPFRFGALDSRHRGRLAEVLAATGVFTADEVGIALELFDETFEGVGWSVEGGAGSRPLPSSTLHPPPSSYEFIGAFDEADTLVAYVCYGPTPGTDGTFDLYWIAVHPDAQRAGTGSGLLTEVERRLRQRGGRLLIVETSSRPGYARTRRFYDTRGYREAARVADFYAPADDRVIYAKRLRRAGTAAVPETPSTPDSRGARHHE
jgi:ribosomal protein S18 acetylase RimI-like enzyme